MHIYFSGVGGSGIGPLVTVAKQAGFEVSGSDKQHSSYIEYLKARGINDIHVGQTYEAIAEVHETKPIDWFLHSSAVSIENPNAPEFVFAREHNIKTTKRSDFVNFLLKDKNQKLIAIAGTHGKTTTTAMVIWLFKQLKLPISYAVGAKLPFADMGQFDPRSEYFVYECDEFDRNFLAFQPYMSLITGIDYDHHEIYPTRTDYQEAFKQFLSQSEQSVVWQNDVAKNHLHASQNYFVLNDKDPKLNVLSIAGEVNRRNAWQAVQAVQKLTKEPLEKLIKVIEDFPGLSRRFEKIADNLYSDYAHTPPKIRGALQTAQEKRERINPSQNLVVVYEPLTNRRQHFIKEDYRNLFQGVKKLYWVPSYLAREDPNQPILTPEELIRQMDNSEVAEPAELNEGLKRSIQNHLQAGDLVVAISGGGGGSLDEWLRSTFKH